MYQSYYEVFWYQSWAQNLVKVKIIFGRESNNIIVIVDWYGV